MTVLIGINPLKSVRSRRGEKLMRYFCQFLWSVLLLLTLLGGGFIVYNVATHGLPPDNIRWVIIYAVVYLILNLIYLLIQAQPRLAPSRIRRPQRAPGRIRRMIGLWFDAKESE